MNDRGRWAVLALIMAGVATSVVFIAFIGLYQAAFEQQKIRLQTLASSQRNLIEAVARFDAVHSAEAHDEGSVAATLSQVDQALRAVMTKGSEDILLATRSGDMIRYLTRTRIQERPLPKPVPFSKSNDAAMYLALSGKSGTLRTKDMAGEEFLVAFDYIPGLKAGLVARLSIRDIQRPFIKAGLLTGSGALLIIVLGFFLFRQISSPLIQRFESALENLANAQRIAHIGSWNWDIVSGTVEWSDEIYRLFGHQPQSFEATYEAFLEAIHPDDQQSVQDAVSLALETGNPYHVEHRIVLPNGEVRYAEEQGEVTYAKTGEPIFMNGIVNDITEQIQSGQAITELNESLEQRVKERTVELQIAIAEHQQTQELLQYNESRMRAIVGSAADGIITTNEEGRINGFNSAAEKIFGWSVTEVINKNISMLMPESHAKHHDGYLSRFLETGEAHIIGGTRELPGRHKDGTEFPMDLAVSVSEVGERQMYTGIVRDISERKAFEAELERQEKHLRDTLNNMPGAIIFTGNDAKVVVCNDRYSEMCEIPENLLQVGASYEEVFLFRAGRGDYGPGEITDLVAERMASLENPGLNNFEDMTPGGNVHEVRRRPAEGGGVVTIITDITEHKRAEEGLRKALDDLKQTQDDLVQSEKMASLGGLVAGVAHEINTPVGISVTAASHLEEATEHLNSTFASGAMKKSDLTGFLKTAEQSTRMISTNLQRAAELIGSFKQVAVDQSSQEKREFRVLPYLEEVLVSLHPQLKQTKHQVSIECSPEIEADSYPGALSQVITNLIMNSVIHAFDETEEGHIRFSVSDQGSHIEIKYSDDGRGMDEETRVQVFDPFFTTKRGSGGSGLGMNILFNIITQTLDGTVSCTSQLGEGTQFLITMAKRPGQAK